MDVGGTLGAPVKIEAYHLQKTFMTIGDVH